MSGRLRWPVLAATVLGLGGAVWALGTVGMGQIGESLVRLGAPGFALLWLCSAGVLTLLGAALLAGAPGERIVRLPLFVWSRTVREGVSDLLPFSQLGGIVVGARTLIGEGLAPARVYAAIIVDLTTEMFAQLLFTFFSIWWLSGVLLHPGGTRSIRSEAWAGAAVATTVALAFALLQRRVLRFAAFLARRMLPGAQAAMADVLDELAAVYRRRGAVAASFLLNLAAWLASAGCAWIVLRLIGARLPFAQVVALEGLIFALRSVAFVVPGALGVQEVGYLLLAPHFGLDAGAAVSLSLIKRARDIAIGLPALLAWQLTELRTGLKGRGQAGRI